MPNYGDLKTSKTIQETRIDIEITFDKWSVYDWNAPYDRKAGNRKAVVRFVLNGEQKLLDCDRFWEYRTNLRAIYLALEGLRLASQRGILEQYRQFFKELPAPTAPTGESPWSVLGIQESAPLAVAEAAYRALAKEAHSDVGGSDAAMTRLNRAIEQVRQGMSGLGPR